MKRSDLVFPWEIATHLSGARNETFIKRLRELQLDSGYY